MNSEQLIRIAEKFRVKREELDAEIKALKWWQFSKRDRLSFAKFTMREAALAFLSEAAKKEDS
jgi:hypothetical protein